METIEGIKSGVNKTVLLKLKRIKKPEIRLRCRKESICNKDPYEYTYQSFYNQRCHCSYNIKSAQSQYFMEKITENWCNYKDTFRLTNKLLGKDNELPLANEFNKFFVSNISKIMQDLAPNNILDTSDDYLESAFETTERLTNFKLVTDQDILSILHAALPKSYELDLTSGWVYSDITAPYIMDIVNTSIASGSFSKDKKQALLTLLLKMGLDLALCNYSSSLYLENHQKGSV